MDWIVLLLAGVGEVLGVTGISQVNKKKSIGSYGLLIGGFVLSFVLLTIAMQTISMGTAYAVWAGIGSVGSVVVGMIFYGESRDLLRILFIGMVLTAAVGLKLIS
ncbi:DMT family transporter [Ornithinibacillus californiensis]|uniref:DMT family transporter n=1 Tax=Ornithinibacillus californiensis TaxID=161536 RepID=UPI00064D752D|nr:multidrug efflux SMR transporter [Ornithinibacillus californiensis]